MSGRKLSFRLFLLIFSLLSPFITFLLPDPSILDSLEDTKLFSGANMRVSEFLRTELGDKRPIDFLFVGGSVLGAAIDGTSVEKELTKVAGGPFRVMMASLVLTDGIATTLVIREILAKKKVRHLFLDPRAITSTPQWLSAYFFDRLIRQFPPAGRIMRTPEVYGLGILMLPMRLRRWLRIREYGPTKLHRRLMRELSENRGTVGVDGEAVVPIHSRLDLSHFPPLENYSGGTFPSFPFYPEKLLWMFRDSLEEIGELCRANGVKLHFISSPELEELYRTKHYEVLSPDLAILDPPKMIAIPYSDYFRGIPEKDLKKYFYDAVHLNLRGRKRFMDMLLPYFSLIAKGINK